MIDVLWDIVSYAGLVVFSLAIIGTGILLLCGIISIVKQVKDEFKKRLKQRFINVNIAAQNLKKALDKSNFIWYNPIIK